MAAETVAEPGELVVKSQNAASRILDNELDRSLEVVDRKTYRISSPLRLLDSRAKAGFWSDGGGVLPSWFSQQPLDEITVYRVGKSYKVPVGARKTGKVSPEATSFASGPFHPSKRVPLLLYSSSEGVRERL
jgi:hypothetical protein